MAENKETDIAADGTSLSKEEVLKGVTERLKFFFSDANVRQDRFMRKELLKEEGDGFVAIETLLRFNSIKKYTKDVSVVVEAAKTLSDILVLNEKETAIARVEPFTMSKMDENIPLSLYVRNLPVTEEDVDGKKRKKYAVGVGDLRELFESYGNIAIVKLRFKQEDTDDEEHKSPSKRKKPTFPAGSAFVEYETVDELEKAASEVLTKRDGEEVKPKVPLKLGDNTLEVLLMKEWVDSKKKSQAEKSQEKELKAEPEVDENDKSPTKRERKEEEPAEVKEFTIEWKPGCVVRLNGLSISCDREAILDTVAKGMGSTVEDIKTKGIYADFSRGQTNGAIRFKEPSDAIGEIAAKLNSGELEIAGSKVESVEILAGEEETKYWDNFIEFKRKQIRHRLEERASKKKRHH